MAAGRDTPTSAPPHFQARWLRQQLREYPLFLALLSGVLAALGFEPLHWWPLTLVGLAGLLELIARAPSLRRAALIGWLFGFAHFAVGNNWIATAFTYQAAMPAWLGWLGVGLIACYLAIYPLLAACIAWAVSRRNGPGIMAALAGGWIVAEWLRGWVFTGFAWNPLAAVALGPLNHPGLASLAAWTGTYALSGIVVLLAGCWFSAWRRRRVDLAGLALVFGPVVLLLQPGWHDRRPPGAVAFTLVQPDIPQQELNDPAYFDQNFRRLAAQSIPSDSKPRLLLWPESGVPDYLRDGYPEQYYVGNFGADPGVARQRLARATGPGNLLLTGSTDLEIRSGTAVGARNSVIALDGNGMIRGGYAKAHLVPFGEYLPLRPLLEPLGLARLVPGAIDFWPGPGPRTVDLGRFGQAGMQVCYEIVFSGHTIDRGNRPDYIFNPSNDGWFGTWGPPQHLAQARLRAIEEGLPVLRATTTGISAVISADGAVRQYLAAGTAGRLDGLIPQAAPPPLFARLGNWTVLIASVFLLGLSLVARRIPAR